MGTETGKGMGTRMGMQKEKWTGMGTGNEKRIGTETRTWLGSGMGTGTGIWMGFGTETGMGTGNGDRDRGCKGDGDGAAGHNEEPVWRLSRADLCRSASDTGALFSPGPPQPQNSPQMGPGPHGRSPRCPHAGLLGTQRGRGLLWGSLHSPGVGMGEGKDPGGVTAAPPRLWGTHGCCAERGRIWDFVAGAAGWRHRRCSHRGRAVITATPRLSGGINGADRGGGGTSEPQITPPGPEGFGVRGCAPLSLSPLWTRGDAAAPEHPRRRRFGGVPEQREGP